MTMSSIDRKSDIQVTRFGHIFPFGSSSISTVPHITQCCRFSIPERLPLQPFRRDRLTRLPLPPSLMASLNKTVALTGAGIPASTSNSLHNEIDYPKKVLQLEKNITFLQESHALMLKSLHEEIYSLKHKNRELQFELITGHPALPPGDAANKEEKGLSLISQEKVEALENEVQKLRATLEEALKTNSTLTKELQALKKENSSLSNALSDQSKMARDRAITSRGGRGRGILSPEMVDYSDTLRQIQNASHIRITKSSDNHHIDHMDNYWRKGGYLENRAHGYISNHLIQPSHPGRHHHHQPRLPRLPLRNQLQNFVQNQYDMQYQHANILPTLKQPEQSMQNKPRKPRGPRQAKMADQIYNH